MSFRVTDVYNRTISNAELSTRMIDAMSQLANNPLTTTLTLTDASPNVFFSTENIRAGLFPSVQYVDGSGLSAMSGLLYLGSDSLDTANTILKMLGITGDSPDFANIINISLRNTASLAQDINFGINSVTSTYVETQNIVFGPVGPNSRLFSAGVTTPSSVMIAVNVTDYGMSTQKVSLVWSS